MKIFKTLKGYEVYHRVKIIFLLTIFLLINIKAYSGAAAVLPDSLILLPRHSNALLVEKSSQHVFLYSNTGTEIKEIYKAPCSTGEAPGIKIKSGDKKTPEGVYFIKDRYEDKDLSPIYGKKAFPTDYPNFMDKNAGRSGSNIWLHGTNKVLKAMDSNGCIAMENDTIVKFSEYIAINRTPVIIVDTLTMADTEELSVQGSRIQQWLDNWKDSIVSGGYHDYLSFYDNTYLPEISWWKKWRNIRSETVKKNKNLGLYLGNKGIYRHNNIYVIVFDMGLKLLTKKIDFGIRKLFVVKRHNAYKIIGDEYLAPGSQKQGRTDSPLVAAAETLIKVADQGPDIRDVLKKWLKAWSDKDIEKYASYYSKNFHSDGLNKNQWVKRKKSLAERYDFISIAASNVQVKKYKKSIVVRFLQDYQSSGFSATGIKTLIFINEDKGWKIYQESWKRK